MGFNVVAYAVAHGYTDSAISSIGQSLVFRGTVDYASQLPNNPSKGDVYVIRYQGTSGTIEDGRSYVWTDYQGTTMWVPMGQHIEIENYYTKSETISQINTKIGELDIPTENDIRQIAEDVTIGGDLDDDTYSLTGGKANTYSTE